MINVGRISYLNVEPYFHFWPSDGFKLVPAPPRQLAQMAAAGTVDAGALPIVEGWALENDFEPVGRWCLSSREKCGSVFVVSKRPFRELKNAVIGVTEDTSTSAMLANLLLNHRHKLNATFRRGLKESDEAWLVIGDQALGMNLGMSPWPHITDLATEWWDWHKLPFVFARWVVRRAVSTGDKARLDWLIGESMDRGLAHLDEVSAAGAKRTGFPVDVVRRYLGDFVYDMGADGEKSAALFRRLLDEAGILKTPVAR